MSKFWLIIGYMTVVWLAVSVCVLAFPYSAPFFVFFAVTSGWQMGILMERNSRNKR